MSTSALTSEESTSDVAVALSQTQTPHCRPKKKRVPITLAEKQCKQMATQTTEIKDTPPSSPDDSSERDAFADDSDSSSKDIPMRIARVSEWFLDCSVDDTKLRAIIDSGASISTMNYPTYQKLQKRYPLQNTNTKVRGVSGQQVPVHGTFKS